MNSEILGISCSNNPHGQERRRSEDILTEKIKLNNHGGTLDLIFEHISYFYEMMVQLLKCYQSVLSETQIDALKCCVI